MALLNIRNLPEEVHSRLRLRAAAHKRSMEAEAREILTQVCGGDREEDPATTLQAYVTHLYGKAKPRRVVEALIRERRKQAQKE